jgi:hypothetical protein
MPPLHLLMHSPLSGDFASSYYVIVTWMTQWVFPFWEVGFFESKISQPRLYSIFRGFLFMDGTDHLSLNGHTSVRF